MWLLSSFHFQCILCFASLSSVWGSFCQDISRVLLYVFLAIHPCYACIMDIFCLWYLMIFMIFHLCLVDLADLYCRLNDLGPKADPRLRQSNPLQAQPWTHLNGFFKRLPLKFPGYWSSMFLYCKFSVFPRHCIIWSTLYLPDAQHNAL